MKIQITQASIILLIDKKQSKLRKLHNHRHHYHHQALNIVDKRFK